MSRSFRPYVVAAALVALLVAAYAPSFRGDFLWDDDLHITANPTIVGPLGLKEIWTSARAAYFPLVLTNFKLQHALWGLDPLGYRLVTLGFHLGAAFLLWRVLVGLRVPGAWLGAALWALHPVQVESVAWICELKNTQSAVFFLAALLCWQRVTTGVPARRPSALEPHPPASAPPPPHPPSAPRLHRRAYFATLAFAVLAILSKPSTVMLPVALALVTWWLHRRVAWRDLLPLAPFFAMSALAAGWTIWEQKFNSGAIGPAWNQTLPERAVIAGRALWFYLGKLLWPEPLVFIYPRWEISARSALAFVPLLAALAGLAALWVRARRSPLAAAGFFSAAFFAALLFPVLGFFSVYFFRYSFVGDHFQYLASMGPLALLGAAVAVVARRAAPVAGAALLGVCALLTAREAREYTDNEALWRATLAENPAATMARLNLGDHLRRAGRTDEAIAVFRGVLADFPDDFDAHNDLGGILLFLGRPEEALASLERAAALNPRRAELQNNVGSALRALGRTREAEARFRAALALDPAYSEAHNNLGAELAEQGDTAAALSHFETALRLAPKSVSARNNLGQTCRSLGRLDEALAHHRAALALKPDSPEALAGIGDVLVRQGQTAAGLAHLERAVTVAPAHPGFRGLLGRALAAAGRDDDALAQFTRAADLAPLSPEAHNNLGTALAQRGDRAGATARFARAVELAPGYVSARLNLGNALFAGQRWTAAAEHFAAAASARPDDPDLAVRLAVALVNAGRLAEAVAPFETALRLRPSPETHEQFAQTLRALGRTRDAFEHFERAAALRR
jgi:Flp pilus assembly protein TadD